MVGVALAFASFFIIKSPDFSDIFLPSRSPVCDIPDSNAFFRYRLSKFFENRRYSTFHWFEKVVGKWGFWDIDLGNFRELGQDFLYLF